MKGGVCLCLLGLVGLASCNDEWDSHYDGNGGVPGKSLMELVRQDSRLEKFCQILEKTQEDTLLSSSQTYTVWAPRNEALDDVDMDDMAALRRLVRNHIARYTNPTSTPTDQRIYMLNGKIMSFQSTDCFMETDIDQKNILADNGVLHVMKGQVPYQYNVMERMAVDPNYSKVYGFITRWNRKLYDAGQSTTYDSVFVDYNPMLESYDYGIGLLAREDSLYTMVIPDNAAWDAAMERLRPYFIPGSKLDGGALTAYQDSVSESKAGQAILAGLTFPGRAFRDAQGNFVEPTTLDSLYTIDGHLLRKADLQSYFNGYQLEKASNGYVYLANGHLNMADTCTWNPTIKLEAEYYKAKDLAMSATQYVFSGETFLQGVSGNSYLEISATSNRVGITYEMPQVLAGKYEIMVDFVPPVINGLNTRTRLQYELTHMQEDGTVPRRPNATFDGDDLIVQNPWMYEALATDTDEGEDGEEPIGKVGVVTQKVGEVVFPVADYYDGMWFYDERNANTSQTVNTKLRILFNVANKELTDKTWERVARIDRVRLVPVLE